MAQLGVQAMMLKNEFAAEGPFETLRKVREIGYRAIEVSQIPMTAENVAQLARAREELGITVAALSANLTAPVGKPGESLTTDFGKIVDDAQRLGASMLRIGMLPMSAMRSLEALVEFADRSNEMAERLADHGIRLYYHNHHIEFAKVHGTYLLDIIADRAPRIGLELDVHWIQRGGLDPATTIRAYGDRVAMVHLKDYRIGRIPEAVFEQLDAGDTSGWAAAFAGVVEFAEVGEGNLDFPGIIAASLEVGAQYLLVEQDEHYGRTPLDCLRTSYDNLVGLGFADLF